MQSICIINILNLHIVHIIALFALFLNLNVLYASFLTSFIYSI